MRPTLTALATLRSHATLMVICMDRARVVRQGNTPRALVLALFAFIVALGCTPAASPARRAESACAGVPADESAPGLFRYRDAIDHVEPLRVETNGKIPPSIQGAKIYLHALPGLTPEWLGHVLECHLSHRIPCPSGESCPLEVGLLAIAVRSTGDGYVVDVKAQGSESGREVLRRARALATARP